MMDKLSRRGGRTKPPNSPESPPGAQTAMIAPARDELRTWSSLPDAAETLTIEEGNQLSALAYGMGGAAQNPLTGETKVP